MSLIYIYVDGSGLRGELDVAMHSLNQEEKKAVLMQMYEKAASWNLQVFASDEYLPIVTPEMRSYGDYYFEDNVTPARMMEVYRAVNRSSTFPESMRNISPGFKIDDSDVQQILAPYVERLRKWREQYFVLSTMSGTPVLVSRKDLTTYSGKKVVGREPLKDVKGTPYKIYWIATHFKDNDGKTITIDVWDRPYPEDFAGFLKATEPLVKTYDKITQEIRTIDYGSTMRENRLREVEKVNEKYEIKLRGVLPGEWLPEGRAYGGRAHQIILIRYNDTKYAAIEVIGLFDDYSVDFKDITKEQFEQAKREALRQETQERQRKGVNLSDTAMIERTLRAELSGLYIFSQEPSPQDGSLTKVDEKTLKTIVASNYHGYTERVTDGETRQQAIIKILPNTYRVILNEAEFRNNLPQGWYTKSTENTPRIEKVITIVKSFVKLKAKAR